MVKSKTRKQLENKKSNDKKNKRSAKRYNNKSRKFNKIQKITPETVLAVIFQDPRLVEILYKNGVPCVGCPMLGFEASFLTLQQVADTYDINLKKLLKELNVALRK